MRSSVFAIVCLLAATRALAGDVTENGVRTLTDTTLTVTKESELGAGVTNVVLDNATLNFNLAANVTLTNTYVAKNGGRLGVGPAGRIATIKSTLFIKPSLGNTFGKTGAGELRIGTVVGKVNTPTTFTVDAGTLRLTSGDFFGGHSATTTNFAIRVREGATWHNGTAHCSVGPVELTGATWMSDNPSPWDNYWSETSFKGGIVVHPASVPSKIYATSWDFLSQPPVTNSVIDVETGADLYVYADLHDGKDLKSVLVKRGGGTLHLMGVGSWTGGTLIEGGKIVLGNAKALGTGAVTVSDGIELAVNPGITVTCPELKGSGTITVSGKGGISFPTKAATITGANDRTAEAYNPVADGVMTVQAGVNDLNVAAGQTVTLTSVQEYTPGAGIVADIRKTGAGTLVLDGNLAGKYRKLIAAEGVVAFANDQAFGMSGIGNYGGVEVCGGTMRPTTNYTQGATRFTFTGAGNGLDVPAGVLFKASSNCFYSTSATITKTGAGGWQLNSGFQTSQAKVANSRWIIDEGRLFTTGGGTFSSHSACWNGTIEVHENGEFAIDVGDHQPVGHLVLRGGTVRAPISQFPGSSSFTEEGGQQWTGFSFNGGIEVLASEKTSRIIARLSNFSQETLSCEVNVAEGAILEMDTGLRPGFSWTGGFRWQRGLFTKSGKGTLRLLRPLSLTGYQNFGAANETTLKGLLDVKSGTIELKEGGCIDPNAEIRIGDAAKIVLNDGARFVAQQADVAPAVLGAAEVWIDATRVSATDGQALTTIANRGTVGGSFEKFPTAVSGGIIPEAPTYVTNGINGKPSFNFNGIAALKLDAYKNTSTNCEIFVVACWTNFNATGGQGQWGGLVSLGSTAMQGSEDQYNKGVLSCYFSGSGTTINTIAVMFGNTVDATSPDNRSSCQIKPGSLLKDQPFVFRMMRRNTWGSGDIWRGDDNMQSASSGYKVQPYDCRIDRICLGSRLMKGGCATTYAAGNGNTRNLIGNIGEVLVFTKELTADEKAAVNDYLRRKWIGTSAAVTPAIAAGTAAALAVETPTGAKAAFAASLAGNGQKLSVTKTGAGELTVGGGANGAALDVAVQEGTIRLQDGKLASRVPLWIDADDATTCLTNATGHVTNLVNKGFCGGAFGQALSWGTTPNFPVRTENSMNGRATLTFDGMSAMMLTSYTNCTAPRRLSIYCVQRRNRWELHPDVSNGGGRGKWATVYSLVPTTGTQDELQPGCFHVDESAAAQSYIHLGYQNNKAIASQAIPHPGTAEPTVFVAQVTTNGYVGSYETAATSATGVALKGPGNTSLNLEPYQIERVILGARVARDAKVHYYGPDTTSSRCWYGDLAELIVTTEPLALHEEHELMSYLRKKWLNKGPGSATPPSWLAGEAAAPQFGSETALAMADGTALVHDADAVTVGALETEGTVDWTRLWSGETEDYPMFAAGDLSLGTVNLRSEPAVRKEQVKLLDYDNRLTMPTWRVFRGNRERPNATVSDQGDSIWLLDQIGLLLLCR